MLTGRPDLTATIIKRITVTNSKKKYNCNLELKIRKN